MAKSISLEDLVVLNDEIVGLIRAGVPLELGLTGWGRDVPGELGRTATRLGASVAQGRSLSESLLAERDRIPPVYSALVQAGMRAGRLPAALESAATTARNLAAARSAVGLAVLYPLMLVLLAYGLLLLLSITTIPQAIALYEKQPPRVWLMMRDAGQFAATTWWGFVPPLVLLLGVAAWWRQTRRAMVLGGGAAGRWLKIVPIVGHLVERARGATMAEILGALVEQDVPLDEAVVLSADCTADRRLMKSAREVSSFLRQGGSFEDGIERLQDFPPLVAWLISAGGRKEKFLSQARHLAQSYRRSVARDLDWLRIYLPIWLMVVVGGLVVGLYALSFFLPYSQLLHALSGATTTLQVGK